MRYPQVVVYERDDRIAALLRKASKTGGFAPKGSEATQLESFLYLRAGQRHGWWLREVRRRDSCWRLLRRGGPCVLILRVQRPQVRLETLDELTLSYKQLAAQRQFCARQMELLQQVHWLLPTTATVVVGDVEDAALSSLAWDLGANYALFPPQPRDQLVDIVAGLMESAITKQPETQR